MALLRHVRRKIEIYNLGERQLEELPHAQREPQLSRRVEKHVSLLEEQAQVTAQPDDLQRRREG